MSLGFGQPRSRFAFALGARGNAGGCHREADTAAVGALADPAVDKRLLDVGQEIVPVDQQSPDALSVYYKAEIEKWWPIIKAAGIKPE
jgi:hypothetical protein